MKRVWALVKQTEMGKIIHRVYESKKDAVKAMNKSQEIYTIEKVKFWERD